MVSFEIDPNSGIEAGRVEDDDDKERERPRGVEGVKTFGLG